MSKKLYKFNYDYHKAEVEFEVDLAKFTPEMANETLTFFLWNYDEEADPVDEVMKKYAMRVLQVGNNYSTTGVIRNWDEEGFCPIDGSFGITLKEYESFEFDQSDLEMEVTNG